MYDFGKFFGGCLTVIGFFLVITLLSTLAGAFIGMVVGWFFGNTILAFFATIGIEGFTMTELGAILGFVGGFFRGTSVHYTFPTIIKEGDDKEKNAGKEKKANRGNF